jgi:uncharacterized membrane protein YphA (DoxX/SURF4 family)
VKIANSENLASTAIPGKLQKLVEIEIWIRLPMHQCQGRLAWRSYSFGSRVVSFSFITVALFSLALSEDLAPAGFSAFMHAPIIVGLLVGLAQFAGGLAILTGVLTRIGAVCIIIVMLGAILLVHLAHGFDISGGGMEYGFTQLLIAIAPLITGAGSYSLTSRLPEQWRQL